MSSASEIISIVFASLGVLIFGCVFFYCAEKCTNRKNSREIVPGRNNENPNQGHNNVHENGDEENGGQATINQLHNQLVQTQIQIDQIQAHLNAQAQIQAQTQAQHEEEIDQIRDDLERLDN